MCAVTCWVLRDAFYSQQTELQGLKSDGTGAESQVCSNSEEGSRASFHRKYEFFLYDFHPSANSFYMILSCVTRIHTTLCIKQTTTGPVTQYWTEGVSQWESDRRYIINRHENIIMGPIIMMIITCR